MSTVHEATFVLVHGGWQYIVPPLRAAGHGVRLTFPGRLPDHQTSRGLSTKPGRTGSAKTSSGSASSRTGSPAL